MGRIYPNGVIDLAIHQAANACAAPIVIDDSISGAHARIAGKGNLVRTGMSGRDGTCTKCLSGGRTRRLEGVPRASRQTANERLGNGSRRNRIGMRRGQLDCHVRHRDNVVRVAIDKIADARSTTIVVNNFITCAETVRAGKTNLDR